MRLRRKLLISGILLLSITSNGCVGAIVGAAVDTTIEVVKIPFKVVGAAVDLAIPDDDEDDEDDEE
ncbi:MAG: hypothetical protein EXR84_08640 [Gammaproteobacteria bacterium]|nr:hypothetical protein [Gammaproteobacteria bacterium]